MLKKIFFAFTCCVTVFLYYALFKLDISAHKLNKTAGTKKDLLVLMSYADGHEIFHKNQNLLQLSSADKGFDIIYNFNRNSIDQDFYEKNKEILDEKTGAGYWLWKPYLIYKTLCSLPNNTTLLYLDSGCLINAPLENLLDLTTQYDFITAGAGNSIPLRCHLKKEAYSAFDFQLTEEILNKEYIWGYFILLKNTPEIRKFIKQWLAICCIKNAISNTPIDFNKQDKLFRFHTHDQSLLAPIVAKYPERKKIISRQELRKKYGITHHHRHKDRTYNSLLLKVINIPKWLDYILWNNLFFRKIREFIY